jgi:hypothetical protein
MRTEAITRARLAVFAALVQMCLVQMSLAAPSGAASTDSTADMPEASSTASAEGPLSHDEIRAAVAKLSGDPNLAGRQVSRVLRSRHLRAPAANTTSWARGLRDFLAQWLGVLSYAAGAAAVAAISIWLIRWLRALPPAADPSPAVRARGAGGLDIDPASLPEDIGADALALLKAERTREALSLLYRGALSRAVHRYGVLLRESYTESEALRAVNASLGPKTASYVAELIGVRERSVYAGKAAAPEAVENLCRGFAPSLDEAAS